MKNFTKAVLQYFLQGLLYVVPIVITIYVVLQILVRIDNIIPFEIPGLGIVIIISGITLAGYIGSTILSSSIGSLIKIGENVILKIPGVKIVYAAIKDLLEALTGKKKTFNKPVLVRLSKESNIQKLGFITRSSLEDLGINGGKVAVYLPHSYAFSGNLFIVDIENVTPIDASSTEVMKLIVSGGVTTMNQAKDGKEDAEKVAD